MDRVWDSFLEERPGRWGQEEEDWLPAIDLTETSKEVVVNCEVPGMNPKDFDISLTGNLLTIKGEKKQEKEEKKEDYHLIERSYGSFTRTVQLPGEVMSKKISASYEKGVLRIVLPKSEQGQKKGLKIKVQ